MQDNNFTVPYDTSVPRTTDLMNYSNNFSVGLPFPTLEEKIKLLELSFKLSAMAGEKYGSFNDAKVEYKKMYEFLVLGVENKPINIK